MMMNSAGRWLPRQRGRNEVIFTQSARASLTKNPVFFVTRGGGVVGGPTSCAAAPSGSPRPGALDGFGPPRPAPPHPVPVAAVPLCCALGVAPSERAGRTRGGQRPPPPPPPLPPRPELIGTRLTSWGGAAFGGGHRARANAARAEYSTRLRQQQVRGGARRGEKWGERAGSAPE